MTDPTLPTLDALDAALGPELLAALDAYRAHLADPEHETDEAPDALAARAVGLLLGRRDWIASGAPRP